MPAEHGDRVRRACGPAREPGNAGNREYVFVIEQGLGHVVHGMNIARVLSLAPEISGTLIPIRPGATADVRPLPLVKNWSVQASWATRRVLRRQLAQGHPDALLIHTQVAALFSCKMMRTVPSIISLDATPVNFDTMAEAYEHPRQHPVIEAVKTRVNRRALRAARAVVTWSRWAGDSVVRDYGVPGDRVHVIPPGVDLARFRPSERERGPGPVRVLFVGGDFERKGGSDLLEVMRELNGTAQLDIVSSAPIEVTGPSVRVHSGVAANSATITDLYRNADIFALPSRGDCTPLAISEALASGLPVVASSVGALPELVVDGHNGLIVPPRDPRLLADALATLIGRPELCRTMGVRSREMAEAEHDTDTNCRRIFALMGRIAQDGIGMSGIPTPDGGPGTHKPNVTL